MGDLPKPPPPPDARRKAAGVQPPQADPQSVPALPPPPAHPPVVEKIPPPPLSPPAVGDLPPQRPASAKIPPPPTKPRIVPTSRPRALPKPPSPPASVIRATSSRTADSEWQARIDKQNQIVAAGFAAAIFAFFLPFYSMLGLLQISGWELITGAGDSSSGTSSGGFWASLGPLMAVSGLAINLLSRLRTWWRTPAPGQKGKASSKPRFSLLIFAPSALFALGGLVYIYFVNSAVNKDAAAQLGKDASQVLISPGYGLWIAIGGFLVATVCSGLAAASAVRAGEWSRLRMSFRAALGAPVSGLMQPERSTETAEIPTSVVGAATVVKKLKTSRRARIAAAAVVALIIGGSIGTAVFSGKAAPSQVAMDFVNAIGNRDAAAAWSDMTIPPPIDSGATSALLTEQSLAFGLSGMQPQGISGVHIESQQDNTSQSSAFSSAASSNSGSNDQTITVGFQSSKGPQTATLNLTQDHSSHRYLFFPSWKVVVNPTPIQISTVPGGGQLTVDGVPISGTSVSLLGGHHTIQQARSGLLQSSQASEDIAFWTGQPASQPTVTLNPQLTSAALKSAKAATATAFAQCIAITTPNSNNCPQSANGAPYSATIKWSLVGNPTDGLTIANAQGGQSGQDATQFSGSGVYAMVAEYADDSDPGNNSRQLSSGPYQVTLNWQNGAFVVTGIQSGGNTQASAPSGVSNAQVLQAVATGSKACAGRTVLQPASCPQQEYGYNVTNTSWTIQGDPTTASTATVQFSGSQDAYVVTGAYTMQYSYTDSSGSPQSGSENKNYTAQVVWDGKNLALIAIAQA